MNIVQRLKQQWIFAVVTCNDDFTDLATSVPRLTGVAGILPKKARKRLEKRKRRPMAVLCQETKNTRLRQVLPPEFGVTQYVGSSSSAGVAVVWDTEQAHALTGVTHRGWTPLVTPHGHAMETRGVVWQDVEVGPRGSGRIVRLASAHRPPERYSDLWPAFDRSLRTWSAHSPYPILLGMDTNTHDLVGFRKNVRFRYLRGFLIDAVLSKGERLHPVAPATPLPKGKSDHHPIRTLWFIGNPKRSKKK